MNIDDAFPKCPPDVTVEEVAAVNAVASVLEQDDHKSCSSSSVSRIAQDATNRRSPITAAAFDGSSSAILPKSAQYGQVPESLSRIFHSTDFPSSDSPIRCAHSKNQAPHLPHEDADYQQRICGTPDLRTHLLAHHSTSDSQLHKDEPQSLPLASASNQSSASIDCMFGAKRAAAFSSEARRSANRSRLLDRSAAGAGGFDASKHSLRRVSFPDNDSELVTGYLEPANPWATGELLLTCNFWLYCDLTNMYVRLVATQLNRLLLLRSWPSYIANHAPSTDRDRSRQSFST